MTGTQGGGHVVLLKMWMVKDCRSKTERSYVAELGEKNVGSHGFIVPTHYATGFYPRAEFLG